MGTLQERLSIIKGYVSVIVMLQARKTNSRFHLFSAAEKGFRLPESRATEQKTTKYKNFSYERSGLLKGGEGGATTGTEQK